MADIEDGIWETYRDDGVLLYGVNDESEPVLRDFIDQVGITFPVILGAPDGYTILGGLSPFPRDYIINAEGVVQYAATEYRPTEMSAIIERLLPTGIGSDEDGDNPGVRVPRDFLLQQNFPNPFNPSTTIRFEIRADDGLAEVDLAVFTMRGRRVRTLLSAAMDPGSHVYHWDGTDDDGRPLPSGTYIYRLKIGEVHATRKMIIAR